MFGFTNISSQRAHRATTAPVAVDLLDQEMVRGVLDRHTFVLVGDLDVVDPDVGAPDIDPVEATLVTPVDNHVVDLAVGASVYGEVKLRGVDEDDVVNGEVLDIVQAQETCTVFALLVELVAVALDSTLGARAVELKVGGVLNHKHVARVFARSVDGPLEVDAGPFTP